MSQVSFLFLPPEFVFYFLYLQSLLLYLKLQAFQLLLHSLFVSEFVSALLLQLFERLLLLALVHVCPESGCLHLFLHFLFLFEVVELFDLEFLVFFDPLQVHAAPVRLLSCLLLPDCNVDLRDCELLLYLIKLLLLVLLLEQQVLLVIEERLEFLDLLDLLFGPLVDQQFLQLHLPLALVDLPEFVARL